MRQIFVPKLCNRSWLQILRFEFFRPSYVHDASFERNWSKRVTRHIKIRIKWNSTVTFGTSKEVWRGVCRACFCHYSHHHLRCTRTTAPYTWHKINEGSLWFNSLSYPAAERRSCCSGPCSQTLIICVAASFTGRNTRLVTSRTYIFLTLYLWLDTYHGYHCK